MSEKSIANIEDALYAIEQIESYTESVSKIEELQADKKTYDAVLMNFIVIAMALDRLENSIKESYPTDSWDGIRRFRNYIAHDYFGVHSSILWQVLTDSMPKLKRQLIQILEDRTQK